MSALDEIKELVRKNRKRLYQELIESKELMVLITKSTHTKLTEEEKEKVKEQLIDILKGIPAFTIFMLPGGVLLLPLVIKFIPEIMPSSFRKDEEE